MKKFLFLALLVSSFIFGQTAPPAPVPPVGSLCDVGANAASTLLIPYFEVDSQDDLGLDTLIAIVNTDNDPIIAHAVIWNVDSWEIGDFNIYLTGYDVATFSMRELLNGIFPNNGCPSDGYKFTTRYIDCDADGTYFGQNNANIAEMLGGGMDYACYPDNSSWADRIKCFTSVGSYDGWSVNYIGYMTIDTHITCNGGFPTYASYFFPNYLDTNADAVLDHGMAENTNTLMGDIIFYDYRNSQSDGMPAVHIEAFGEGLNSLTDHQWGMQPVDFQTTGIMTFYTKYVFGWFGNPPLDCREPLPIIWGFRYIGNVAFDGGTWVDFWRSHNPWFDHWFISGGPCNWPGTGDIYTVLYNPFTGTIGLDPPNFLLIFDEEERTITAEGCPSPCPVGGAVSIPLETQRVQIVTPDWPLPAESGWIYIDFATDQNIFGQGFGNAYDQSWVNVRYSALNKYTVGLSGVSLLNGCVLEWDPTTLTFIPGSTH